MPKPFKLQAWRLTLKSILITKFVHVFLIFPNEQRLSSYTAFIDVCN